MLERRPLRWRLDEVSIVNELFQRVARCSRVSTVGCLARAGLSPSENWLACAAPRRRCCPGSVHLATRTMPDDARHITILMGTLNGARHLQQQLDSFLAQSHRHWSLWVSDDGSTDETQAILARFRAAHPERDIRLLEGPRRGAARNYLSLLCHPDLVPGYVALSDQDDVWLRGKLARALRKMDRAPGSGPRLYAGQYFLADAQLRPRTISSDPEPPSFGNAVVQNLFGGHSIVLDPAALALVRGAGVPEDVPFHDWWLYLLISGAGGRCVLDAAPVVLYRQHEGNLLGGADRMSRTVHRLATLMDRNYGGWIAANLRALDRVAPLLTPEAQRAVHRLRTTPSRRGPERIRLFAELGLRRQTQLGRIGVGLAALFGRV